MLNVQNLTNTLSRMPLPQLQQYAALHKNDPYVVSLALSIANQKKQMMAGQAGQAGMMPQPKVVDQDIAQMVAPAPQQQALPEDTGIGQLPAQNMQRMAGGGIVAFGPGGSTGEEDMPEWLKVFPPESGLRRVYRAAKEYDKNNPMPVYPTVPTTAPPMAQPLPPSATQVMSGLPAVKPPPSSPAAAAAAPKPVVAPTAPAAPAAPAPAPVDLMTGIKQLDTKTMSPEEAAAASSKFGTGSELTAGINQLRADTIASNKELSKAYEEGIAKLPKPGEEAEARLKQREAEDAVGKADAKAMAIFKAGLSMMAGTSQNAFENIGKGAMAGLEDYSASIKDFRKLATERDKAYAEIEAARNAAARDDFKTSMNLQERATDRLARVNEKGIDVTATLFKTNKEAAATIWNTSNTLASANARSMNEAQMQANKTVFEQSAQTQRQKDSDRAALQRAQIQANAPTGLERIYRDPELFKRHMESQTAATGMRGDVTIRETWAKSPYLQSQYPNVEDYVRMMSGSSGGAGGDAFKVIGSRPAP